MFNFDQANNHTGEDAIKVDAAKAFRLNKFRPVNSPELKEHI
jgi:hypothetical protein